jgi:hypothetical protein
VDESQDAQEPSKTRIAIFAEPSMDLTYRFRYLLYFIAFMFVMSVCFVYAKPVPEPHLLLHDASQHSGFLQTAIPAPSFDPAALRTAITPAVTPQTLEDVLTQAHSRHLLPHRHPLPLRMSPAPESNESSALPAAPRVQRY